MKREYPDSPLPAVGVIIYHNRKVLIIKRAYPPSRYKWSIPGGVVEIGEPVREAARREVQEELGLRVRIRDVVDVLDNIVSEHGHVRFHFVLIDFWAELQGGILTPNHECLDAQWISREKLSAYDLTRGAQIAIEKVFQLIDQKTTE
ncbi:MAG: NUDIX hydrolase [Theionarchaea archaeon]|nr:NUDIX hydrolase [Theionarchaea archaeon]